MQDLRGPSSVRLAGRLGVLVSVAAIVCLLVPPWSEVPASAFGTCTGSWTESPSQDTPVQVLGVKMNGVSVGTSGGWTVGGLTDVTNTFHAFAEYWTGSEWQIGAAADANTMSTDTWLNDVVAFPSGPSGKAEAWAVGYAGPSSTILRPQMIVEHWVGPDPRSPWTISAPTAPSGAYSDLTSVSGSSATDVWAVGSSRIGAAYKPLIEHYDGAGWRSIPGAQLPAGTLAGGLISVSAASKNDVWAVGYRTGGTGYRTLVEHFDGTRWSVQSSPSPGTLENVLLGVTAAGPNNVWAVGYRKDDTVDRALIEHYDGTKWTTVASPSAIGAFDVLRGVAVVPTTGEVWAVGFTFDIASGGFRPITISTDPSRAPLTWTVIDPATQNGKVIGHEFKDVAGEPSADQVWAVGYSGQPLIETICPTATARPAVGGTDPRSPVVASPALPDPVVAAATGRQSPPDPLRQSSTAVLTVASDVAASALPGEPALVRTNGAAVGDFAGPGGAGPDGYPDFQLGRFGDAPMELWVNQQDGTWAQVGVGTLTEADRYLCAFGDAGSPTGVAPDGLPDLFCTIGAAKGTGIKINELWVQKADGSFVRPATQPGVLDPFGRGRVATFFFPGDERSKGAHPESLYVGNQLERGDGVPEPSRFYFNQGGTLVDSPASGLDVETGASCVQPMDVNRDHFTDLLLCTNLSRLVLFRNDGPVGKGGVPSFTDVSDSAGITQTGVLNGLLSDLSGDGCPDLVEVMRAKVDVLIQKLTARGQCASRFTPTWSHPLKNGGWAAAGDVNGDHRPDVYVLQGGSEPDLMLLNDGDGTSFSSIPVPQAGSGQGDMVRAMKDRATGFADFLVLNGDHAQGPVQLIRFSTNPSPNPLTITAAPPPTSSSKTATFEFRSTAGTGFLCSMDGVDPVPCHSGVSYSGLGNGAHLFAVWALDGAGNVLAEATDAFKVVP